MLTWTQMQELRHHPKPRSCVTLAETEENSGFSFAHLQKLAGWEMLPAQRRRCLYSLLP